MPTNDQVQKYYDALIATYDVLTDAIAKSGERGVKVTAHLAQDISAGQRETLELGKKLSSEGADISQLYTTLVEATTAAQGRALAFAQFAYQEALEAGSESRTQLEKLVEANRDTTKAAVELARAWSVENPVATMFQKSMDAFTPSTAKKNSKPKATASAS